MSVILNEVLKEFWEDKKHLYLFYIKGSKAVTGKGSRTYINKQVWAVSNRHLKDKAEALYGIKSIKYSIILGKVNKKLEDRYFKMYGAKLEEIYGSNYKTH